MSSPGSDGDRGVEGVPATQSQPKDRRRLTLLLVLLVIAIGVAIAYYLNMEPEAATGRLQ